MTWANPIPLKLQVTAGSMSFRYMLPTETGLPILPHPGAFGAVRKHHVHEGVDLYCPVGTPVSTVESGIVVAIIPFTGPQINMDWWLDTHAVLVEGESGVVLYGEIEPADLTIGQTIDRGTCVGHVKRVLVKDKGRPTSMLHLELYIPGTREAFEWVQWNNENGRPAALLDPTEFLKGVE